MPPDAYEEFLDLPPGPRPPNHYALLAIPLFETDPTVLHDAGLNQNAKVRRWALHPDREKSNRIQELLNELGRATFVLEDPRRKAEYDLELAQQLGIALPTPPAPAAPSSTPTPAPPAAGTAEAPAPPRGCPACGAPMEATDRFCSACGFDTRERTREAPAWLAELGRELRDAPRWVWAFHLTALGLALAFLSGPWLWAFLALCALALPWMILRMPWLHIAMSLGSIVALFVFLSWVTRGIGIENLWKGTGRAGTTAPPAQPPRTEAPALLIARAEKAIELKDSAAAKAALAELKKVDATNSRLADLQARVAALKPQVYKVWPFDTAEAKRRQEETARALGVKVEEDVDVGGGAKLTLVLIPAGEYVMGSPREEEGRSGSQEDQKRVRIEEPFWLGKYEVTQEQWEAIMGNNPSLFKGRRNPVESVPWDTAQEFVRKLNSRVAGGRFAVPTEAQWEWACRAGAATRFSFGDREEDLIEYGWYRGHSSGCTHAVGEKKPNAWGLSDMHGNVWEWCAPLYVASHDGSGWRGAEAPGQFGVLRGGSWNSGTGPRGCRSADRYWFEPGDAYGYHGVRVLRTLR